MKHIAIIPNYSGVTDMISDGQLSPNFLVKSENDQKVYFSNAAGLRLVVDSGNTYNMYSVGADSFEADFSSTSGFSFRILGADNQYLTANFDWDAEAMEGGTVISQDSGSTQNENHFVLSWGYGDTSWQVVYDSVNNLVQVTGSYTLTDEEACTYHGGTWDPVNQECVMPTCEEQGLCGDDPYNCHECSCQEQFSDPADVCACEGGYFWDGECHDEPEPVPEPTCEEQGLCDDGEGNCVDCPGPCDEYEPGSDEQLECECIQQGGSWEGSECVMPQTCEDMYEEGTQELCECQGKFWYDDECHNELEPENPCEEYDEGSPSREECECIQQGGSWEGSDCVMPSDEQ